MMKIFIQLLILSLTFTMSACSDSGLDEIKMFMKEVKAKGGKGRIEPIPTFSPYKPFDYGATLLRSPFVRPVVIENPLENLSVSAVKPDDNRPKEFLEQFSVDALSMVGTIERAGITYALLEDPDQIVHYVKQGNFVGRNHGEIVKTTSTNVQIVEIVPSGESWVQRPRSIELSEKLN